MIDEIISIFKRLQETTSRTEKEAILKENENNEDFRKILYFLFNPYIVTGIKEKKLDKFADYFDHKQAREIKDVFQVIEHLKANNSGRDEDVKYVMSFINDYLVEETKKFLKELFTKKLKCGITASTINKVYGKGTIPEFDVMLAKAYKDHGHKLNSKFYVTLKLDGIRCVAIKKDGVVKFFTRLGQPIEGLVEIEEEILELPDDYVYDGELLLANYDNLPSDELFRETQKVVRKDGLKKMLEFHIFDTLPVNEFLNGKSTQTYEQRRNFLETLFTCITFDTLFVVPVLYSGTDKAVISDLLQQVVNDGHEGLMINTADGKYVTKRSDVLLKVKEMHTVDLKVIGIEEGSGKFKGTLGALIVDYKGNSVNVGSGFTDVDRNLIWNNMRDEIVGKIVEVQYFEESSNQDGGISLRFPVFIQIRDDKTEPSYD